MFDINSTAIDVEASEEGKWFDYEGGSKFLIARHSNDAAETMRAELTIEHWDALTDKENPEKARELQRELECRVLCQHVLKDWKGVGSGGTLIKYTPEEGMKYLGDKRFKDLRRFVEINALNAGNWRAQAEEKAVESVKDTAAS